jgi:hypothetical protein
LIGSQIVAQLPVEVIAEGIQNDLPAPVHRSRSRVTRQLSPQPPSGGHPSGERTTPGWIS